MWRHTWTRGVTLLVLNSAVVMVVPEQCSKSNALSQEVSDVKENQLISEDLFVTAGCIARYPDEAAG